MKEKPMCPIIGANGNIYNILGIASKTLKSNDMADEAKEMYDRVTSSHSYPKTAGAYLVFAERFSRKRKKYRI